MANRSTAKKVDRVAGMVIHNDKVLVMERYNHEKKYYTFPGGGIDEGEVNKEALTRELMEETSVVAIPKTLVYVVDWNNGTKQFFYFCSYVSGEPKLSEGSIEMSVMKNDAYQYYNPIWVDINELPNMLVYPLEIRDWFIEDLERGNFKGEVRKKEILLDISTCRQEL